MLRPLDQVPKPFMFIHIKKSKQNMDVNKYHSFTSSGSITQLDSSVSNVFDIKNHVHYCFAAVLFRSAVNTIQDIKL